MDYDEQRESEEIGGAVSSRNPLLTQDVVPGAHWRLVETDRGVLIQSQGGDYQCWYLDFDNVARQRLICYPLPTVTPPEIPPTLN